MGNRSSRIRLDKHLRYTHLRVSATQLTNASFKLRYVPRRKYEKTTEISSFAPPFLPSSTQQTNIYLHYILKMIIETATGPVRSEIFRENARKEVVTRLNWSQNWQWYIDLLREREKAVAEYKKSSPKALAVGIQEKPDKRSVLPFPVTTSGYYGWLASKKEFELEIFGSYFEKLRLPAPDASSSAFYSTSEV